MDLLEQVLINGAPVIHAYVDAGDVDARGLGQRGPSDLANDRLGVVLGLNHEDDLAGCATDPLGVLSSEVQVARVIIVDTTDLGAGEVGGRVPLPGRVCSGLVQGLISPFLETDELCGRADALAQARRGEYVALVPVGLEHYEVHGDPLEGIGTCAVCHRDASCVTTMNV